MSSSALGVAGMLAVVLGAGCPGTSDTGECLIDTECNSPDVCARDHQCLPSSEVREVTVTWTVNGQPASATSCASMSSFPIQFFRPDVAAPLEFSPVMCELGQFFIDKLPLAYTSVGINAAEVSIANNGTATLDL